MTISDYQSDLKESTDRAVGVIAELRRRANGAERLLAEVVLAAGGRLKIHSQALCDPRRNVELTIWRNEADQTIEFTAKCDNGEQT